MVGGTLNEGRMENHGKSLTPGLGASFWIGTAVQGTYVGATACFRNEKKKRKEKGKGGEIIKNL
tara:strand:- start:1043 stop:1234 length:192 start_codon:yes stop_codon:yes gene_type:complete